MGQVLLRNRQVQRATAELSPRPSAPSRPPSREPRHVDRFQRRLEIPADPAARDADDDRFDPDQPGDRDRDRILCSRSGECRPIGWSAPRSGPMCGCSAARRCCCTCSLCTTRPRCSASPWTRFRQRSSPCRSARRPHNTEIFRAGIQSIHRGQIEAAQAVGIRYPAIVRRIILPQALRVVAGLT